VHARGTFTEMVRLRVRLLGPVDATVDGEAPVLSGRRRTAVLATLALHRDTVVSANRIIELVWADGRPATAANTLQRHVSHLRAALGDRQVIQARPPGCRLADAAARAERSLELSRAADDLPGVAKELNALGWSLAGLGDFERARQACEEAAAIYRGAHDPAQEGAVQHSLGHIHRGLGDPAASRRLLRARAAPGRRHRRPLS
jgi:DNA-binding SARP family transcriptional activator